MGFESQEEAERWAENAEFRAEQAKEEKLLAGYVDPKEAAWQDMNRLPGFQSPEISEGVRGLMRATFDFAWQRAMRLG